MARPDLAGSARTPEEEQRLLAAVRARLAAQRATAVTRSDPFSALAPVQRAIGDAGGAVGSALQGARQVPGVGGALDALSTISDAAVRTPLGLAALGADRFLGTGLTEAAQRRGAGRPLHELPKFATEELGGAFDRIAGDPSQDARARLLAQLGRLGPTAAEFGVPLLPGVGLVRGVRGVARTSTGRPLRVIKSAAPAARTEGFRFTAPDEVARPAVTRPTVVPDAPTPRYVVEPIPGAKTAVRVVDTQTERIMPLGFDDASKAQVAADRLNTAPSTTVPKPAASVDPKIAEASALFKQAAGITEDVPIPTRRKPGEPSEYVRSRPDLMAKHDANEAVIAAVREAQRTGDMAPAQEALERLAALGGDVAHTAQRIRGAGIKGPTVGELSGAARARAASPVRFVVQASGKTARVMDTQTGRVTATGNAKNARSLADMLNQVRPAAAGGGTPPPPRPPAGAAPAAAPPPDGPSGSGPRPPSAAAPGTAKSGWDTFLSAWNLPKALKASLDLSAPFRQGVLLSVGHPREFFGAMKPMLQALRSDDFARALDAQIRTVDRPGLYLGPIDDVAALSMREEQFISKFANRIPGISASNRAYVTYLNKLRADVYDSVLDGWNRGGKNVTEADRTGLANVINHFTGRGDLPGGLEGVAPLLNGMFFSPRFAISRIQSAGDALGVIKSPSSLAAREAASNVVKLIGAGLTVLTLAQLAGMKVEADPRSSAFGKIQVNEDTSVDIWGGMQTVARHTAQLITGQQKPISGANAGKIIKRGRDATIAGFVGSKGSPAGGAVRGLLLGPSAKGEKANESLGLLEKNIGRSPFGFEDFTILDLFNPVPGGSDVSIVTPIGWDSIVEAIRAERKRGGSGVVGGAAAALDLIGFGSQTIEREQPAKLPTLPSAPGQGPFRFRAPDQTDAAPVAPTTGGQTFRFTAPAEQAPTSTFRFAAPSTSGHSRSLIAPSAGGSSGNVASTIRQVAQEQGEDPLLGIAVGMVEANLDPSAVGDNGESYGVFQERLRLGRGGFTTPDPDPRRQAERFYADVRAARARGFRGTPGQLAAAVQRPFDPVGYARKVDAIYARR